MAGRKQHVVWEFFEETADRLKNGMPKVSCNFCNREQGKNATKCKQHLQVCSKTSEAVKALFKRGEQGPEPSRPEPTVRGQRPISYHVIKGAKKSDHSAYESFALALVTSNISLSFTENKHLHDFFERIGSSFRPPSRRELLRRDISNLYAEVERKNRETLDRSPYLALGLDAWTNVLSTSVFNVIALTPEPILYKSLETGSEKHTGEFFCRLLQAEMETLNPHKVTAVVTDNAANMIKFHELLAEEHPHILGIRCFAHTLNLLIGDLLKLPSMNKALRNGVAILRDIKSSGIAVGSWNEEWSAYIQEEKINGRPVAQVGLSLPVVTRWYSNYDAVCRVLKSREVLRRLEAKNRIGDAYHAALITERRGHLWKNLEDLKTVLEPMIDTLKLIESDKSTLSDVVHLIISMKELTMASIRNIAEKGAFRNLLRQRCTGKFVSKAHYLAYLLDPRYMGADALTPDEYLEATDFLSDYARLLGFNLHSVGLQLNKYEDKGAEFTSELLLATLSPQKYWLRVGKFVRQLGEIGARLLGIPASNASVERSFSFQGRIHTSERSSLTPANVAKLMAIRWFYRTPAVEEDLDTVISEPPYEDTIQLPEPFTTAQLANTELLLRNEERRGSFDTSRDIVEASFNTAGETSLRLEILNESFE